MGSTAVGAPTWLFLQFTKCLLVANKLDSSRSHCSSVLPLPMVKDLTTNPRMDIVFTTIALTQKESGTMGEDIETGDPCTICTCEKREEELGPLPDYHYHEPICMIWDCLPKRPKKGHCKAEYHPGMCCP